VPRVLAVAALSAATLAFEILLVRLFAIEQFYHFAYMAIGVAMLGFGASGTLLALAPRLSGAGAETGFRVAALLTVASLVAVPAAVDAIPLDPTQLAWDARQWPRLGAVYVLLALPFACGALAVVLGIALEAGHPGRIYGASFMGSGIGAAAGLAVLGVSGPERALAVPAVLAAAGAGAALLGGTWRARAVGAVAALVAAVAVARPPWRLDVLPYKGLPQVEALPDAERVADVSSPTGWVVAVRAPAFRYAPGLSLAYRGAFPEQTALFVDAGLTGAVTQWARGAEVLDWVPAAIPYALGRRDRVLVLEAGGALEVAAALAHGAREVTAVEPHREVARFSASGNERWLDDARVRWVVSDARSYAATTAERYDLVTIPPAGGPGGAAAGIHALAEDFTHTVEAYQRYLELLTEGGVLALTRWVTAPPRENVRVILTAAEAARRAGADPAHALVVVRSWGTATTLVKPAGFDIVELDGLAAWAESRRLDVDWQPGLTAPGTRFNLLEEPVLFQAARAAASTRAAADAFAAVYPFAVEPATDARPYPRHYLRARTLGRFLERSRGEWLPFAEWGYVALLATLAQSVALAAVLIVLPAAAVTRSRPEGFLRLVAYFGAIGFAYLAAEIAAIQQLTLLLGHPVYAVTAVLAVLLVCSGIGSWRSDRAPPSAVRLVTLSLAALFAVSAVGLLGLVHLAQGAGLPLRAVLAGAVIAPPAVLMGLPFPLGLRVLAGRDRTRIAWAWAVNGFASVVAAPLAAVIALEAGSAAVFATAAGAYLVGAGVVAGARDRSG
jgi:hypothetical protein